MHLLLVDGPRSEFRSHVARSLADNFVTMQAVGHIGTTPETYVRMMSPVIDQIRPVVIECSWVTQERHCHMLNPIAQQVFKQHEAQRLMLYRLALGCGALSLRCLDVEAQYREAWVNDSPVLDTVSMGDWSEDMMEYIVYRLSQIRNPGPGIGRWAPHESILLVGDQHGDTVQPYNVQRNIAFCSMSGKGCSEWLTALLHEAGFSETMFYWINAREPKSYSGRPTPHDFLEKLQPYATIAMGNIAEQWCVRAGIPYRAVPHPQWWKRFHYREEYPLIPLIREIHNVRQPH